MSNPSSRLRQVTLQFQAAFKDGRENLSAVELTPEGHLWLGSDETASLERLSPVDAQQFAQHQCFAIADFIDLPGKGDAEIDIEGLAYADHYLWLVGSHSYKRKQPKAQKPEAENLRRLATVEADANRYLLARIPVFDGKPCRRCPHPERPEELLTAARLDGDQTGNLLTQALADDPHLGPFLKAEIPGKDNGFDIEGLAVHAEKLFLGLRGPVLRGWAILLELAVKAKTTQPHRLKLKKLGDDQPRYRKHFLDLGGLGIRDLCLDGPDLLILAGPTMALDGPVQLFRLQQALQLQGDSLSQPERLLDLPHGVAADRAEGITHFAAMTQTPSVLVVYDSPAPTTRLTGDHTVLADVFELG